MANGEIVFFLLVTCLFVFIRARKGIPFEFPSPYFVFIEKGNRLRTLASQTEFLCWSPCMSHAQATLIAEQEQHATDVEASLEEKATQCKAALDEVDEIDVRS